MRKNINQRDRPKQFNNGNIRFQSNSNELKDYLDGYTEQLTDSNRLVLKNKIWKQIMMGITQNPKTSKRWIKNYSKCVTVFSASLILSLIIWVVFQHEVILISTGANNIQEIYLPDGSLITLNENSTLEYRLDWNGKFMREVYLDGEGLFEIAKLPNGNRFTVNPNSPVSIEVLGTTFNFKIRNQKQKISLINGKVEIKFEMQKEKILLSPGESIKYDEVTHKFDISKIKNITFLLAWKDGKMTFDKESLTSILLNIGEIYDLEISEEILSKYAKPSSKFSGSLPIRVDSQEMLTNLSLLFDLNLKTENNIIMIQ
jgi:transmembrane sensor